MPNNLHIKQLEQAVRSLSMLAMLYADDMTREELSVEAIYFVKRFFGCWEAAVHLSAKSQAYWKLTLLSAMKRLWIASVLPPRRLRVWTSPLMTP